jgi:hypothetical protein
VPWWGVPLVAGLFAFAGVAFAQISTFLLERRRAHRDDEVQQRSDWRQASSEFLLRLEELRREIISARRALQRGEDPATPDLSEVLKARTMVQLLCPERIVAASGPALVRAIVTLRYPSDDDKARDADQSYLTALDSFINAVRKELNLPDLVEAASSAPLAELERVAGAVPK